MEIISKSYLLALKDVYGESVDKIIQGNLANIVFLKSNDETMIEVLMKLSGQTHVSYIDQKTITNDAQKLINQVNSHMSYTMTTKERSVITMNDMLFIPKRNSIVFSAGNSPIWNRNEFVLPMAWRLHQFTIVNPKKPKYALAEVPTLSSTIDFDIRKNQPDVYAMLTKRCAQARKYQQVRERYMAVHELSETDMARRDPDILSDELMGIVNQQMREDADPEWKRKGFSSYEEMEANLAQEAEEYLDEAFDNEPVIQEHQKYEDARAARKINIYAKSMISKFDLTGDVGHDIQPGVQTIISKVYAEEIMKFKNDTLHFTVDADGNCYDKNGNLFVKNLRQSNAEDIAMLNSSTSDPKSRAFAEDDDVSNSMLTYQATPDFIFWLASLDSWRDIANGGFETAMYTEWCKT